ncbi:hypothetical protein QYE76_012710 [Lolium multiflorum]|uniref:Uncharacterized protein n=1 Tax=Lolium multiflorum TaxID=4521 RepID=A0AAD8U1K1_LOLMU|nr:hypothetical protein QYE76_012710 [Lolium multiflorum]
MAVPQAARSLSAAHRACRRGGPRQTFRLLGRIVELKRWGQDLGPLLPYAQRWNDADISAALASTADARKALFEELLWEHRSLAEAHSKCQAIPEASIEALKAQIATLQAAYPGSPEGPGGPEEISRELKDQAIQAGVRHAEELKAAEAEARLNEALEDANVVLEQSGRGRQGAKSSQGKAAKRTRLPRRRPRRPSSRGRGCAVESEQKEYDLPVTRIDALALRLFPDSQAHAIKKVANTGAKSRQQLGHLESL